MKKFIEAVKANLDIKTMKQLPLTERQQKLLAQMNDLFKKAHEEDLDFIYDISDGSLT